jgi:ArsR family transcriptional regulator, arsenate/arsenite/antimonite-responsive transcriptional repressor
METNPTNELDSAAAVKALAALAQESRLAIFRTLVQAGPDGLAAGRIGELTAIPPSSLSFHLKELSHAALVRSRQDGRFVIYTADFDAMNALLGFLTENCCRGVSCAPVSAVPCCGPTKELS